MRDVFGFQSLRSTFGFWLLLAIGFIGASPSRADLPATIARLRPSVVLVGVYGAMDSPRFTFRGTGFAVSTGLELITNAHVLPEPLPTGPERQLAVMTWSASGQWVIRKVNLVSLERSKDLALLRLEGDAIPPIKISEKPAQEGQSIAFMGFPIGGALGYSHVTHRGMISSIAALVLPPPTSQLLSEKSVAQLRRGNFQIYQLDATAYPGNSGGPVFDTETGELVAVINSVLIKGARETALTNPTGISYAIPASQVLTLLQESKF